MNRILHTVAVTLLAASASAAVAQVKWLKPEEVSRTSEGEVLYYFHRENVALCREVEEDVLSDTRIVEAVSRFHPVWVDATKDGSLQMATSLGVNTVPTMVITRNGEVVRRLARKSAREDYLAFLAGKPLAVTKVSTGPTAAGAQASAEAVSSVADAASDCSTPSLNVTNLVVSLGSSLHLDIQLQGDPDQTWYQSYNIFIDGDGNSSTGYNGARFAGADYMIQGANVHRFSGAKSEEWAWTSTGTGNMKADKNHLIVDIPLASIPNLRPATATIWVNTQNKQWASEDWAPDEAPMAFKAADGPAATSAAPAPAPDSPPKPASMRAFADAKGDAAPPQDVTSLEIESRGGTLLVTIITAGPPALSSMHVLLNADNKPTTGFGDASHAGADFMVEGANLYKHDDAGGTTWKWGTPSSIENAVVGNKVVYTIPRSRVGIEAGKPFSIWVATTDDKWNTADVNPDNGSIEFTP
jgi:hypothetical protein